MSEKAKDPEIIDKNISHKPIDYEKLNKLSADFGKRFTPQQEMDAEQAFWLRISNPTSKPSDASPVKIKAPKELPKVSLVNESLKKLKFHLARFDNVVKIRTTLDAHTKEVLLTVRNYMSLIGEPVNMDGKKKETYNLEAELLKSQNAFNDLLKRHSQLEKHSQFQDKDSTICKLKDMIQSMREKSKDENVKYDFFEIETKNVELENKNEDLKAQIQDKVFVITSLKNDLQKIKGKEIVDIASQIPSANTIVPRMFKLDLEPLASRLFQNREAHIDYLKYTQEQADILWEIVEQAKAEHPLDKELDFALLKRLLLHPKTRSRKLGLKCSTSKSNSKQVESSKTSDSNTPVLSSTGLKCSTSKSGSKPTGNKRNDRISQTLSRNMKNKVEAKPRKVNKKMITSANVVPSKTTTSHSVESQKLELKVYSKKLKNVKNIGSSKKAMILASKNANHSEPNHTWGSNATDIPSSSSSVMTVRFGNDHIARIMGYGDYQLGNVTINGLGHNLFSVGQFCDRDLEVVFQKNTCFIRNLEGVDLLSGSRDINLYIISLDDMLKTSPICLLSKASKTKSWLWHRRLSHLNFGKSKKSSHQPKAEDTNQKKLYLLHMDLCGPMRVASINGKRYILVIVDDYSRFTWVRFLRTKDEAPEAIIKCIKNIQVHLNAIVRNVQTNNGTEFVNQTLCEFYENVGIPHQTSVSRTPQPEQRSINTACYIQNRSIIHRRYNKTPYELMQDKKPDLSFFHVFGALCYPTNDSDDLGKLDAKANIGIFVGYAPVKKAFRIYNKRTQKIIETIHVTFDELTTLASKQFSLGPRIQCMTPATSSSGLVPNPVSQQPCIPPNRDDWDLLFQPIFDEYFTPPSNVVSQVQEVVAPRAVNLADSLVSTSIDQDASSSSTPSTQEQEQSPNISQGFEESPKTPIFHNDPPNESPHEESTSQGESSNVRQIHTLFKQTGRWTKDHPIANMIGDPSRSISIRKQLQN
ncbi:retrovirus-related pol polyprotein from transposon TNT 1-94 [Tanacetum coccineum]